MYRGPVWRVMSLQRHFPCCPGGQSVVVLMFQAYMVALWPCCLAQDQLHPAPLLFEPSLI